MRTTDIYIAAYLEAKDYKLSSVEKDKRTTFIFEGEEDNVQKDIMEFENGNGLVVPLTFSQLIKKYKKLAVSL